MACDTRIGCADVILSDDEFRLASAAITSHEPMLFGDYLCWVKTLDFKNNRATLKVATHRESASHLLTVRRREREAQIGLIEVEMAQLSDKLARLEAKRLGLALHID